MKAVLCVTPGSLILTERDDPPAPPPGWALVGVSHVGICGTDYHIFEGSHPFLNYPRVMGHEVSGRVLQTGDGVTLATGAPVIVNPYLSCGTCVACRQGKSNCCASIQVLGVHTDGAMCEAILVPAANLYPAGDLPLEHAAAVEFLAIGAHAVRRSLAGTGARALVIGAGPIGMGTALFARVAGQGVTLLDQSRDRLDLGQALGFPVIDGQGDVAAQVAGATGGEGFDVVYDATGNAGSMQAAFAHVAHGGALVLVSVVKDNITFSDPEFHKREMMVIGSRNAVKADFDHVAAALRRGDIPMDRILTHRTSLAGAARDIPVWAHQKQGLVKAIIAV